MSLNSETRPTFDGIVIDTIFYKEENGYRIIKFEPDNGGRPFIACGTFGEIENGEHLTLHGDWVQHPRFGIQFQVEKFLIKIPDTVEGLRRYLSSGIIPGIGLSFANKIIDTFGEHTLQVLNTCPERLQEIKGLGNKKIREIKEFWKKKEKSRKLMLFLGEHGIGFNLGLRIQKELGDKALEVLQEKPYSLIDRIRGVGFLTADRMALRIGVEASSPERIQSCALYVMHKGLEEGHTYLEIDTLLQSVQNYLHCEVSLVHDAIRYLTDIQKIECGENFVQLSYVYQSEKFIANQIKIRSRRKAYIPFSDEYLIQACEKVDLDRSIDQLNSLRKILNSNLSILTGGPGVGKTTMVKVLVNYFELSGFQAVLTAPTGRAAQRMEAATGKKASTIHRLLKYNPTEAHGFVHNEKYPLSDCIFIIDEFSMVDMDLFQAFLLALPEHAQLILVGDSDQLPSVGSGKLLNDFLHSEIFAISKLTQVFRQREGSLLVKNSHRIIQGLMPIEIKTQTKVQDYYFIETKDDDHSLQMIEKMVRERIPIKFGAKAIENTQLLSPMKKGLLGTINLNKQMQSWVNHASEILYENEESFKVGDRVIQLNNNYDIDLYNGDLGVIKGKSSEGLRVKFGEKTVVYPPDALSDLSLAYACTVHKSQGSEYPIVIMPLCEGHRLMHSLELIYTAMTRAKLLCVWIGKREYLQSVLEHPAQSERKTRLLEFLNG